MARRASRSRTWLVLTTVAVVALFGGAVYGLTVYLGSWNLDFSTPGRRHLKQIPVDRAQACGSVETIHAALESFAGSYMAATFGMDAKTFERFLRLASSPKAASTLPQNSRPPAWPVVEAEVDAAAQQLDAALADGIPHFPRRLRAELTIVRQSIAKGRQQLPRVNDQTTFKPFTRRFFERGQLHAGYASDLVGDQCSVPLGA